MYINLASLCKSNFDFLQMIVSKGNRHVRESAISSIGFAMVDYFLEIGNEMNVKLYLDISGTWWTLLSLSQHVAHLITKDMPCGLIVTFS